MDERIRRAMEEAWLERDLDWQFGQVSGTVLKVESQIGSTDPERDVPPVTELFIQNTGPQHTGTVYLTFVGAVLPIRVGDEVEAYVNRWERHQKDEDHGPTFDFRSCFGECERVAHVIRVDQHSGNAIDGPHGEYYTNKSELYAPAKEETVSGRGEALGAALRNKGPI